MCRIGTLSAKTPKVHLVQSPEWQVLGPWPGGIGSPQSLDGRTPNLQTRYPGREGHDLLWQSTPEKALAEDGFVDLEQMVGVGSNSTTYAFTTLSSPTGRRVRLHAGSGDAMTVWLNGQEILRRDVYRNPERDEDEADLLLRGGVNTVLVRISRSTGPHGFYFRIADPAR